ncbi:MAG: PHP domain-containing protein [Dehalococcoidia bacterium]|nr:PHP domain-containing protein [Dehalococcoidia bacterium]
MKEKIDLHVHTNASDGKHSPSRLVELAAQRGLSILAITDHDTVDGSIQALEAVRNYPNLKVIPGVEISSHAPGCEVHILGYFIDVAAPEFIRQMSLLRGSRIERACAMVEKLNDLGFAITMQRVREIAGTGSIGRPHIAQALVEKGYVNSFQEVFERYLGQGGLAYVERSKLSPEEAVTLILKSGGLPVLAHPTTISDAEQMIVRLVDCGLVGLECHYKDYNAIQRKEMLALARRYNLIATGGSDYHGVDEATEVMLGEAEVPVDCAQSLIQEARLRGLALPDNWG